MLPVASATGSVILVPDTEGSARPRSSQMRCAGLSKWVIWTGAPATPPRASSNGSAQTLKSDPCRRQQYNSFPSDDQRGLSVQMRGSVRHVQLLGVAARALLGTTQTTAVARVTARKLTQRPLGEKRACHRSCLGAPATS